MSQHILTITISGEMVNDDVSRTDAFLVDSDMDVKSAAYLYLKHVPVLEIGAYDDPEEDLATLITLLDHALPSGGEIVAEDENAVLRVAFKLIPSRILDKDGERYA